MIKFILTKRRVILFIVIPCILAGLYFLNKLSIKLYPNIRKPIIHVRIPHPNHTAEDFYDQYGDTIEQKLNSIKDLDTMISTYGSGRSQFEIEFKWFIDYEEAELRVKTAIDSILVNLPEEAEDYSAGYWSGNTNYFTVAVNSNELSIKEIYNIIYPVLNQRFSKVEEAESVVISDVEDLTAEILINQKALLTYGLTVDEVIQLIKNGYKNISIGSFRDLNIRYNVRIRKGIDSIYDIENILIQIKGNKKILLKDIADVKVKYDLPRNVYRSNGKPAVLIIATPKAEGNIKKMVTEVKKILNESKKSLPKDFEFVYLIDPSEFIDNAIWNVISSGVIGSLLAFFVIILILGEIKNTIIIFLSIPMSIILSFILMFAFNVGINLISLSAMSLAVGMIVDASIVLMENIHRHRMDNIKSGKKEIFINVIIKSVSEVKGAVFGSTITSICVFFPLAFTSPLASAVMGDLAKTIIFTLFFSMLVALYIIPVIAYYLFRKEKNNDEKKVTFISKIALLTDNFIVSTYEKFLRKLIMKKKNTYTFIAVSALILLLLSVFIFPMIKKEIIAQPKSNRIVIRFRHFSIEDKQELLNSIEPIEYNILNKYKKEVRNTFVDVSRNDSGMITITLKSSRYLNKMLDELNKNYKTDTTWRFDIFPWDPASLPLPMIRDLNISVIGENREIILGLMEEINVILNKSNVYRAVFSEPTTTRANEIALIPRDEVINSFKGYNVAKFTSMIRIILNGANVITMNTKNKELTIKMKYPSNSYTSISDLENYPVLIDDKSIPLKHFFDFKLKSGISEIVIVDGVETYNIFTVLKRDIPSYKRTYYEKYFKKLINEKVKAPDGYKIIFENTQKDINEAISSLIGALIISIILIFIVLGIQFNSARIPLLILVTIPLGFIGVILSLFVFQSTVSLNSMLGVILLGGIVVNNAIVIVDFYLQHLKGRQTKEETLIYVAKLRVIPILITSMTTILGMLPLALALGDGSNIIQPLGITVSGGLFFSTFFTLFMFPCILNLVDINKKNEEE